MTERSQDMPVALIAAMPEEAERLAADIDETGQVEIAGLAFREGLLDGARVVLVGCGIGKTNAALATTLLLDRFKCRAVLLAGVAGGLDPELGVGDIVVGTRLVQHDYGSIVAGRLQTYQPGIAPLAGSDRRFGYDMPLELERRVRAALIGLDLPDIGAAAAGGRPRAPKLVFGTILTGDAFVNCEATRLRLRQDFDARAVEMEGASVAQVAASFGVPVVIVRALSDLAGAESHIDFKAFLHETAESAARVVRRIAGVV